MEELEFMLQALSQPLDPARVKMVSARGGRQQPYLEQWSVKQKANEIFGFDGWAPKLVDLRCIGEREIEKDGRSGWHVGYTAIVEVEIPGWPTRSDVGYGDAVEYGASPITCHELAAKEASSDAMKRAMTSLGDQFGNSLYNKAGAFHGNGGPVKVDVAKIRQEQEALQIPIKDALRIVRLVLDDPRATLESVPKQSDVTLIVDALRYYASHEADAEAQLKQWEATHA